MTGIVVTLKLSILDVVQDFFKRFNPFPNYASKLAFKRKIEELAHPEITSMCPPPDKVKTKGRHPSKFDKSTKRHPSYFEHIDSIYDSNSPPPTRHSIKEVKQQKFQFMDCFPREIRQYINHVVDVRSDGHCGFRAIATLLGLGEDGWAQVRIDLSRELKSWRADYTRMFGEKRFDELLQSVFCSEAFAQQKNWMTIPDMGHLIATRYRVVLVHLSLRMCLTFLPLRGEPPLPSNHRVIVIGFVHDCHFVQVFMNEGSPIPPVALQWKEHCDDNARAWEVPYVCRMYSFKELFAKNLDVATQETIKID